ncbi:MAG: TetR family transcriptional regulator [Subtercola sp.]|nr:TetR family transcriptional regulator [Subtercola sp.]
MSRWEPDARGRLLRAALELFAEHGYESTTTAQIAERAGLTKTTLFRLFSDKREIVFQAQDELVALVKRGVDEADVGASPFELMVSGVRVLSGAHVDEHRRTGRILDPILAASPELNERAVFKRFALTVALEKALFNRLVDRWEAGALADLGIRAYYLGYDVWVASDGPAPLTSYVLEQVTHLQGAMQRVTNS